MKPAPRIGKPSLQRFTFIYGLYDPRDSSLRYVGKARNPTKRLITHCAKPLPSIAAWVAELAALGMVPRMRIMTYCEGDGIALEKKTITDMAAAGCDLLNRSGATERDPSWPKVGRKPKPPGTHHRTPVMSLGRVSVERQKAFREAAKAEGMPFTKWANRELQAAAEEEMAGDCK